jgi:hypothetical protein
VAGPTWQRGGGTVGRRGIAGVGVAGGRGRRVGGAEGRRGGAVGVLGSSVLRRVRVVPRQRGRRSKVIRIQFYRILCAELVREKKEGIFFPLCCRTNPDLHSHNI